MKILFAADHSKYAGWTAEFLLRLPLTAPPRIQALHVIEKAVLTDPWIAPALIAQTSRELKRATKAGGRLTKRLTKQLQTRWQSVRPRVQIGPIAEKIIATAKAQGADLIIMGSRGLSDMQSFLMGSVSQQVVTYAPCLVLIVKRKPRRFERILLAVDGSAGSRGAMGFLAAHVKPAQLTVTALNVRDYPFIPPTFSLETIEEHVQESIAQDHRPLDKAGFRTEDLCVTGHSVAKILEVARRRKADLIVVGLMGLTGGINRVAAIFTGKRVPPNCET